MVKTREGTLLIVALLALVAVYQDPQASGGVVRDLLAAVASLVGAVFEFAGALVG